MSNPGKGFQITYPAITLHAVSRGSAGPSIYCQLDENVEKTALESTDDDETFDMRELTITPENSASGMVFHNIARKRV